MSNCRAIFLKLLLLLPVAHARAQSQTLLDSLRMHRADLAPAELAEKEFAACEASGCPSLGRLGLLSGVLLLSQNQAEAAVRRMAAHAAPPTLSCVAQWYQAEALAWSGNPGLALASLQKIRAAPAWLQQRVDPRRVELLAQLRRFKEAKAAFAKLKTQQSPEMLWLKAHIAQQLKDRTSEIVALRVLAMRFPVHPHGEQAWEMLKEIPLFQWRTPELLQRAQALVEASQQQAALHLLHAIKEPRWLPQIQFIEAQAQLIRGQEHDSEAQALLLGLTQQADENLAAEAMNVLARRLMRRGDLRGARAQLLALVKRFPNDSNTSNASYLAAWLAMNLKDFDLAAREFATFEINFAESKKRDEARWFQGYSRIRNQQYAQGRESLQSLSHDFEHSPLVPQARYWATRALQLQQTDAGVQNTEVDHEYTSLLTTFRSTLYARLAKERLRQVGISTPPLFSTKPMLQKSAAAQLPQLSLALALAETGLWRDADAELTEVVHAASREEAVALGQQMQAMQAFAPAHALAARFLWGQVFTQQAPEALPLMFPKAFADSVEHASKEHRVNPYFTWAIMRRESAFRPEVLSPADARGLMQVIPPTARAIALQRKLFAPDSDELFSPSLSIDFGAWYLGALFQRFTHPALVAAAYNGGPHAVAEWAQENQMVASGGANSAPMPLQLDSFVEEIPLKETRSYVKQVVADSLLYAELYSNDAGPLDMMLPTIKAGVDF
jgi:soluble lytic murein transglycosylase